MMSIILITRCNKHLTNMVLITLESRSRFLGMLPQDQLQQFIVRAVTGYGERIQAEANDATMKVIK